VNCPFRLQRIISTRRGPDVEMVMEDALEDPKSNIKLTTICGFPQRIKSFPVIICKEGDGKVLVDACSTMKTLNSSHKSLCTAIFQRAMV
jgi:hypothetical protein